MKYKIKVNEKYEFNLDRDALSSLDSVTLSQDREHALLDDKKYDIRFEKTDFIAKHYEINVNGNLYKVEIHDELDLLISGMGLDKVKEKKDTHIISPMPGLILNITVKPGDQVHEGDPLLVLEAMKMENQLSASGEGIVKEILVNKGDAVDKGQLLIELE